jgi:murein L,D-transpeptidase YafK
MKTRARRALITIFGVCCVLVAAFASFPDRFPDGDILMQKLRGRATVSDRVVQFGPTSRARWEPLFKQKTVDYPPQKLVLVGLKREKQLQIYAADSSGAFQWIRTFPILGLSGKLGPKLRFGDLQVPEGLYRIESLNPNSAFHLSLRVNYPNEFDRAQAEKEGRTELGSDIMIHGSNASIGCLAMGDEGAEDLFVLASDVGLENIKVILSPLDFRTEKAPKDEKRPAWVDGLYTEIAAELRKLPSP